MSSSEKSLRELQEDVEEIHEQLRVLRSEVQQLVMAGFTSLGNRIDQIDGYLNTVGHLARLTSEGLQGHIKHSQKPRPIPVTAVFPEETKKKASNEGIEVG